MDYAYSKTGDHSVAEDITSETFVRALRSIQSVRDCGKDFGSWLMTIARNIVVDIMKSSWNRHAVVSSHLPEGVAHFGAPEKDALDSLDRVEVVLALGHLSSAQRECVWLRFFANLSVDEVGQHMGRSRTSVRALQYRAIKRLADVLPYSAYSPSG